MFTVVAGVAAVLAALLVIFNVVLSWEFDREADEVLRTRAAAELSAVRVVGAAVVPPSGEGTNLETRAWIFQGDRAVQAPRVDASLHRAARTLARADTGGRETRIGSTRLLALPIRDRGGTRIGTVVAGLSVAPYDRILSRALLGSIAVALAVLITVALAAGLLLRAALRPVAQMTRDAANWSDRDLDQRFGLGPAHDEITGLAATLDALLDRLAAGMRHERDLTAEISHELRTPLAHILGEIELALRRPRDGDEYRAALERVAEAAGRIQSTIETLLAAARHGAELPRGTCDADTLGQRALADGARLADDHGVRLEMGRMAGGARVGVTVDVGARILQPLIENACAHAASTVTLDVGQSCGMVEFMVIDDGPGVGADEAEEIFTPGQRGTSPGRGDGAGLGLALSRRVARAAGGEVTALAGPGGRFRVRLPAA